MKLFGRWDCRCQERKDRISRWARRLMWRALGIRSMVVGEHMTIMEGTLTARIFRAATGKVEERDLGYNTIPDVAADFLANDLFDASTDVTAMDFHGWGTGACAIPPACGSTALVTAASEARVSGTASKPAARQYRSVATITADGTKTITEWGLFSAASAGTAWSLRCFAGIPLVLNDQIEFTYTLTVACVTG